MPGPVAVAVHVAPELSRELSELTVKSCSAALGAPGRCHLAADGDTDDFDATVSAADDGARAHIRLARGPEGAPVAERDLAFASEDSPQDRWASVGVVIAALVTAASGAATQPSAPRVAPAPKAPPVPKKRTETPEPAHPLRIDALARLARETVTHYPAELGGVLRLSLAPARSGGFAALSGGYAARVATGPDLSLLLGALGGGFRWGDVRAPFGVEAHAEVVAERWIWSASEPGRTDTRGVWRFGGAVGVDATWGFSKAFQAVLGIGAQGLAPGVEVSVQGRTREREPAFGPVVVLGVRAVP